MQKGQIGRFKIYRTLGYGYTCKVKLGIDPGDPKLGKEKNDEAMIDNDKKEEAKLEANDAEEPQKERKVAVKLIKNDLQKDAMEYIKVEL